MTNLAKLGVLFQPELCASSTVNVYQLGLDVLPIQGLAVKSNKGGVCLREENAGTNLTSNGGNSAGRTVFRVRQLGELTLGEVGPNALE